MAVDVVVSALEGSGAKEDEIAGILRTLAANRAAAASRAQEEVRATGPPTSSSTGSTQPSATAMETQSTESDKDMLLAGISDLSGSVRRQLEENLAAITAKRAKLTGAPDLLPGH